MTPEQFVYWLQGFAEVNQKAPNDAQWTIIKDHLQLVFKKETPNRITSPGPSISSPAYPNYPSPPTWPTSPFTISPTYPGTRPEVICSVSAPGAGTNWSSGIGSYDYHITAEQYKYKKLNEDKVRFRL